MTKLISVRILVAALVLLLKPGILYASFTYNLTVDTKALSLGNAVTADPPGIKSIHYNPAGLAKLKGRQFEFSILNAYADIDADFLPPPDYNIFGINGLENDPILGTTSHTNTLALFIPGKGMQKLPKGPGVAPSNGISYNPPGSKFTFATALFLPQVAGFYRENDDPARYMPKMATIQRISYFTPSLGYEVNDEWSVGFGVHFSHQAVAAEQWMRAPNMLLGVAEILQDAFNCETGEDPLAPWVAICGGNIGPWDDIGVLKIETEDRLSPSYTVGVLWEPTDWFAWGANYASDSDMKLKGDFIINYTQDWVGFWQRLNGSVIGAITAAILSLPSGVPSEAGNVSLDLTYPQHFQTGVSVKVHPRMTVNVDASWTDWAEWDSLTFRFDRQLEFLNAARILSPDNATSTSISLPLNWKSPWNWSLGIETHVSTRLDLRMGFEWRDTVVPDDQRSLLNPFGSGVFYNVGMGYKWDKDTQVDGSVSFFQAIEYIPANTSCNINCDNLTNIVYNPYAGLDVKSRIRFAALGLTFRTKF